MIGRLKWRRLKRWLATYWVDLLIVSAWWALVLVAVAWSSLGH